MVPNRNDPLSSCHASCNTKTSNGQTRENTARKIGHTTGQVPASRDREPQRREGAEKNFYTRQLVEGPGRPARKGGPLESREKSACFTGSTSPQNSVIRSLRLRLTRSRKSAQGFKDRKCSPTRVRETTILPHSGPGHGPPCTGHFRGYLSTIWDRKNVPHCAAEIQLTLPLRAKAEVCWPVLLPERVFMKRGDRGIRGRAGSTHGGHSETDAAICRQCKGVSSEAVF